MIKNTFYLSFLLLFSGSALSQTGAPNESLKKPDSTGTFVFCDVMPEYPGGIQELYKFIGGEINYPENAKKKRLQGKCFIRFVVTKEGYVGKTEIQRGVPGCKECDAEAVRVIKMLKQFKPGINDGKPVPVWYVLPINFKLK